MKEINTGKENIIIQYFDNDYSIIHAERDMITISIH